MSLKSLFPDKAKSHCCNTGEQCESIRPSSGAAAASIFVAHPFSAKMDEWVHDVKTELQDYVPVRLPESTRSTGVLFCKICQDIRSSSAILSEVTDLNRNVVF